MSFLADLMFIDSYGYYLQRYMERGGVPPDEASRHILRVQHDLDIRTDPGAWDPLGARVQLLCSCGWVKTFTAQQIAESKEGVVADALRDHASDVKGTPGR